MHNTSSAIDN